MNTRAQMVGMWCGPVAIVLFMVGVMMCGGALTGPFVAAICTQLRRVEGPHSTWSFVELGMGFIGILLFILPCFVMEAAAFRPERDPELTRLLNDAAWIPFVGAFMPAVMQNVAIAMVVFKDDAGRVFPRWLGYFNLWTATLFTPAALLVFFKTGPFAWSGVLCFWLPLTVFGIWFFVMAWALRGAILRQAQEGEVGEAVVS
jgi:hypothetical protein